MLPVTGFLMGALLGALSAMGVGGGSLLMLWLTLGAQMEYARARQLTLLFFLPSALTASVFRACRGSLPFRKLLPAFLGGVIAAGLMGLLPWDLSDGLLRKAFGLFLILTGLKQLCYRLR